MNFKELLIDAPAGLRTPDFLLRPIYASDAQLDYDAVMESRDYLRKWEQSTWPEDDFTVEANRDDMVKLEKRHKGRESFSYTVMNLDETECFGCVYLFPPDSKWLSGADVTALGDERWSERDATLHFWVRKSQLDKGLDRLLLDVLLKWFEQEWSFESLFVVTNEHFDQQVKMFEGAGLERRFEVKLADDPGRYLAYA